MKTTLYAVLCTLGSLASLGSTAYAQTPSREYVRLNGRVIAIESVGAVTAPTFAPAAGTYATAQTVKLTSTPSDASIRYTIDGTTPTSATGLTYSDSTGIAVSTTTTIKAIAYKTGWTDSGVATATYTITGTVSTPTFTPAAGTYATAQTVKLTPTPSDASIHYTIDGTTPTSTTGLTYSDSTGIAVSTTTTIKAIAYKTSWTDSGVATATYTITGTVSAPTFTPAAGTYTTAQTVKLAPTPSDANIHYTVDGTTPTSTTGLTYSDSTGIAVSTTTTIKAIAYKTGWADSSVVSATYTITGTVAAPTFSIPGGTYTTAQTVSLTSTTSGASIHYTTDGVTTPSATAGTLYTGAITISAAGTTTLQAVAYESGWTSSGVVSAQYTITGTVAAPTFSIPAGTYTTPQTVTLATTTSGANIRYTTDGVTTPSATTGTLYGGGITVSAVGSTTIKAIAYKTDWANSSVVSATYTISAETITTPGAISGTTAGMVNNGSYSYTSTGSTSSYGHAVQYQYSWGDGTVSGWSSSATSSHGWGTAGTYSVTLQARCQPHTSVVSSTVGLVVTISPTIAASAASPSISAGAQDVLSANQSASWQLAGGCPGSISTTGPSTTTTYTAPSSVTTTTQAAISATASGVSANVTININPAADVLTLLPNTLTQYYGQSIRFTSTESDPSSWNSINDYILIAIIPSGGSTWGGTTCMLEYQPYTNTLYNMNTDAATFASGVIGVGTASTSKCAVNLAGASVTRSGGGTTLTMNLPVTFPTTFGSSTGLVDYAKYLSAWYPWFWWGTITLQ